MRLLYVASLSRSFLSDYSCYLLLIGAQAKNECLFVTIPDHPKFGSLSDRDVERIFKYLVGLARYELGPRGGNTRPMFAYRGTAGG